MRHALQAGRSRGRFPMVSLEFFRPHFGPGVDSASNRNKYQEYFLVGKGLRCVGLTTLLSSCAGFLEIWDRQPPATLRVCPDLYRNCFTFTFYVTFNAAAHPRRTKSSITPLWKLKTRNCILVFLSLNPCVMSYFFLHYQPWKSVISRRL